MADKAFFLVVRVVDLLLVLLLFCTGRSSNEGPSASPPQAVVRGQAGEYVSIEQNEYTLAAFHGNK
jgi:hypothetical protein